MGLRHTIAQTAGDIVSILRTRVELFGVEFNLEKSRLFRLIGLAAAAFIFLLLAVMVVTFLLIAVFWDSPHRLLTIGLIAGFYALFGLVLVWTIFRNVKSGPIPFQATAQELSRDISMLSNLGGQDSQKGASEDSRHRNYS